MLNVTAVEVLLSEAIPSFCSMILRRDLNVSFSVFKLSNAKTFVLSESF